MIITTVALTSLLTSLVNKGLDKTYDKAFDELSEGSIKWVKTLFCKEDGQPKSEVVKFLENPESKPKLTMLESMVESDIEDNPSNKLFIDEIVEKLSKKDNNIKVTNSKNVNTGSINSGGGSIHIGDVNGK
jgi:hypothetical protein